MAVGKKGKKGKNEEPPPPVPEEVVLEPEPEPEVEEVQFTETSYTSASFESLPPVPVEVEVKPKKKKKKVEQEVVEEKEEEFQWSEDSLPEIDSEEVIKVVEVVEEPKKKKKGKKDKKEKEQIPEFEKPKNWKKMNKKEREVWMEQQIAEWRIQQEIEKQAFLASLKEKRKQEAVARAALIISDSQEQEVRRDLLQKCCNLLRGFEKQKIKYSNDKQAMEEWQQYLRCDGLPDPRVVTQMATYIHLWQNTKVCDDDQLERRCKETLPLLEKLEDLVANARQFTERQAANYDEIRVALRAQLSETIQYASFTVLRDLEKLQFSSIKLATYQREFQGLKLNIWVAIRMPTCRPPLVEVEEEPVVLEFPSMRVSVTLPRIVDASCVCVRAAKSLIDLLSELSRSHKLWDEMPGRYDELFVFNVKEYVAVVEMAKVQEKERVAFYKAINARIKELETIIKANIYVKNKAAEDEVEALSMKELVLLDPRLQISLDNEARIRKYLKKCNIRTRKGEIHLRKYRICGGILNLDLLETPPQSKRIPWSVYLTTLELPKALRPIMYQVQYRAPPPPESGVIRPPEEIEAELKKIEQQYQKLALVHIELPKDIMWTEPPQVCQWQEKRKLWTTNYVNDYKYNEDQHTVQFRTGVLWPIGLATLKYSNLPFQGWDIKPDPNGKGVLVCVTGVCVTVTWLCIGNFVKLVSIANATSYALRSHFGKKYSVKRMVALMQEAACDFFPDFDAHNHVEGTYVKEWAIERHSYHVMAILSRAYNFTWSKWNGQAGYRSLVFQFREAIDAKRQAKYQLLRSDPQRTEILKINEHSAEYSAEPVLGMPFFPDLFTLNMSYGSVDARRSAFSMKYKLVETVFELLQELKLLSYS